MRRDALQHLPLTRLLKFPYRLAGTLFGDDESAARLVKTYSSAIQFGMLNPVG
jgi:hypothetical protein